MWNRGRVQGRVLFPAIINDSGDSQEENADQQEEYANTSREEQAAEAFNPHLGVDEHDDEAEDEPPPNVPAPVPPTVFDHLFHLVLFHL